MEPHLQALSHAKRGQMVFIVGPDRRLHVVREGSNAEGAGLWESGEIGGALVDAAAAGDGAQAEVVTFSAAVADSRISVVLTVKPGGGEPHEVFLTDELDLDEPARTKWRSLGRPNNEVTLLRLLPTKGDPMLVAASRESGGHDMRLDLWVESRGAWARVQPQFALDGVVDFQPGKRRSADPGLWLLYTNADRRYFGFARLLDLEGDTVGLELVDAAMNRELVRPAAFAVAHLRSGPATGLSEVYLVDEIEPGTCVVRHQAAHQGRENPPWTRLADVPPGAAPTTVLATRNDAARVDVYLHAPGGDGVLSHLFRDGQTGVWSPVYPLQRGLRRLAPTSSTAGRVCEIFALGDATDELLYLCQDARHGTWSRGSLPVKDVGLALPITSTQTRVTFNDVSGAPVLMPRLSNPGKLTITASGAANVRINGVRHLIAADRPVVLDARLLVDGLEVVTTITEADAPFFRMTADFFQGAVTFQPVQKLKDDLKHVDVADLLGPTDRYGDALKRPLVEGPRANEKYLRGVLRLKSLFFNDIAKPVAQLGQSIWDRRDGLVALVEAQGLDLGRIFDYAVKNLLDLGLEVVEKVFSAILSAITSVTELLEKLLTSPLNLPVVTALWRRAFGGEAPSIVDGMALLLAVPTTVFLKLTGIRPKDEEQAEGPPMWTKHLINWASLLLAGINFQLAGISTALNWADKVPGVGPVSKLVTAARLTLSSLQAGLAIGVFHQDPTKPSSPAEANARTATRLLLGLRGVDVAVNIGLVFLGSVGVDPKLLMGLPWFWSILYSVVEGICQVAVFALRLIVDIPSGDGYRIADTTLSLARGAAVLASRFLRTFGDMVPPEGKPAIFKALLHGTSVQVAGAGLLFFHLPQTICATVRLARPRDEHDALVPALA